MTARKERKRGLREARLARERALARARRRKKILTTTLGSALGLGLLAGIIALAAQTASKGTVLAGLQASAPPWQPSYDGLQQRISALRFPPNGNESFHIHALLHVFANGQPVTVPANVGITAGVESPLHTHNTTGVIHIEAGEPFPFKVSDFFNVWGVKFTSTQLGSLVNQGAKTVQVFVNGQVAPDGPAHVLGAHDNIVVAYGLAGSFPTTPPTDALAGL